MDIVGTADLYESYFITNIQKSDKNNTRSNFQSYNTYVLEQGGINITEIKQAQN